MAMVDKKGRLVRFTIRPGNAAESKELATLLDGVLTNELIADKAYDGNPVRLLLASQGIVATIPPTANRLIQTWYDPVRYRTRHLVETTSATSSSSGRWPPGTASSPPVTGLSYTSPPG